MISFSPGFTAASAGVSLMKRREEVHPKSLSTAMPPARLSNWIIPGNFIYRHRNVYEFIYRTTKWLVSLVAFNIYII